MKIGVGREVTVTLDSGARTRGTIESIAQDSLVIRERHGELTSIPLAQVSEVRKTGMSRGWKIAIYAGVISLGVFCLAPYPIGFICKGDPS